MFLNIVADMLSNLGNFIAREKVDDGECPYSNMPMMERQMRWRICTNTYLDLSWVLYLFDNLV
jgi:hypothetical protein